MPTFDAQIASGGFFSKVVYSVKAQTAPVLIFPPNLYWSAQKIGSQVRVDFGRELRSLSATTIVGNYVITGPSAITISSVVFTPGDRFLFLNYSGNFTAGNYTLTMAPHTAEALADNTFNDITTFTFNPGSGGGADRFNQGLN